MPFPRNYADILAAQAMAVPEAQLDAEIDRLDVVTLGAPADWVFAMGTWPDLDAVDPRAMFQAMTLRALLRTRQLALRHDPDAADRHVREQARQLEPVFEALRQKDADTP
jgi:hypothetical protein